MLDFEAIRKRAAARASVATAANLLTEPVSRLATLATVATQNATLAEAVHRCCRLRGDTAEQADELVADCLRQSPEHQADLLAHFVVEAARWSSARGRDRPVTNPPKYR